MAVKDFIKALDHVSAYFSTPRINIDGESIKMHSAEGNDFTIDTNDIAPEKLEKPIKQIIFSAISECIHIIT